MEKLTAIIGSYAIYKNPTHKTNNSPYVFPTNEVEHGIFIAKTNNNLKKIEQILTSTIYPVLDGKYNEFYLNLPQEFLNEMKKMKNENYVVTNNSNPPLTKIIDDDKHLIKFLPIDSLVVKELYEKI